MSYLLSSRNSMNSLHMRCCRKNNTFCKYFSKSFCRCSKNCIDRFPMTFKFQNQRLISIKCIRKNNFITFWCRMSKSKWMTCYIPSSVATDLVRCFVHSRVLSVTQQTLCIDVALSNGQCLWRCGCYKMLSLKQSLMTIIIFFIYLSERNFCDLYHLYRHCWELWWLFLVDV